MAQIHDQEANEACVSLSSGARLFDRTSSRYSQRAFGGTHSSVLPVAPTGLEMIRTLRWAALAGDVYMECPSQVLSKMAIA